MGNHSANQKWDFVDRGDWPQAIICFIFLIIFPVAIIAIWTTPPDDMSLYFIAPFTLVFALTGPFLVRQVWAREQGVSLSMRQGVPLC